MNEPRVKGRRYNWHEWFSQKEFKLYKDIDYNGVTTYFASYMRRAAKRHGYIITIVLGESDMIVTVHGRTEEKPEVHNNIYRKK